MRMRGPFTFAFSVTDRIFSGSGRELQVRDPESRAARLVWQTFDFPSMRQNDLLNHGKAQASPFLVGGEIRFENLRAMLGRHAGAIIANLEDDPVRILFPGGDLDVA